MAFEDDIGPSAENFQTKVKPKLENWLSAEIVSVEATTQTDVAERLDRVAGVDAWEFNDDNYARAIGSRVQWGESARRQTSTRPWNSFTIRCARNGRRNTEYQKRRDAVYKNRNEVYPEWTVQAYVTEKTGGRLMSFALVRTEELIKYLGPSAEDDVVKFSKQPGDFHKAPVEDDDGTRQMMYVVFWPLLAASGVDVWVHFERNNWIDSDAKTLLKRRLNKSGQSQSEVTDWAKICGGSI